jgi:tetratricopeptide (TPR) repeat protein
MKLKSLLVLAAVGAVTLAPTYAEELQAGIQKSRPKVSQAQPAKLTNIAAMIEYNKYDEADKAIKEALTKNPDDVEALSLRAVMMAKQFKLAPAQEEITKLLKKYPNNANLHYAQGLIYVNRMTSSDIDYIKETRSLVNSAIKEFVKCVNADNNYYQAYNAMGVATLKLGNRDDAEELFNTALKVKPDYAVAYDNLGTIELMDNNLDKAENYFKQAMKYNSTNPTAMYHMAQVETRRGNYSQALTWLNHSLYLHPNSSPGWNLQGELYLKQGNEPAAINSFKKAVNVKPENARPYMNLAGVYENRADEEFAMEQLKTVLAINPNYQEGKMKVADLALQTRKYEQALNYYSKLVGDQVYNDRAIVGLANTYYEMSKDSANSSNIATNKEVYLAYDYINKALDRTPEDLKLHLAKLKIEKLIHQQAPSKDSLNRIVQTAGSGLAGSVIKGEAYLALGREQDAVYTFENAINFSNSVDDDLYLAEILVQNKQMKTARTALQKALMRDSNNRAAKNGIAYINLCETKSNEFLQVAQKQFKEKNYASTIEFCNHAIDFFHNTPAIAKLKAQAYEADKNYKAAATFYTQYLAMSPNAADKPAVMRKINKYKHK